MGWNNFVAGIIHLGKKPQHETGANQGSVLERFIELCEEVKKGAEAARSLASEMVRKLSGRTSAYEEFFDDRVNLRTLLGGMNNRIVQMDGLLQKVIGGIPGDSRKAAEDRDYIREQMGILKVCASAVFQNFSSITESDNPTSADLQNAAAALRTMVSSPGSRQDLKNAVLYAQKLARTLKSNLAVLLMPAAGTA